MAQKQKLSKVLLLTILTIFFSGTLPAFLRNKPVLTVPDKLEKYDSTQVILFLDTTVIGPFFFPVAGKVISHYGKRGRRMHTGTDIKLAHGDTVKAAFSGVVTRASSYHGYGILVVLEHPERLETYYAHLSKTLVKKGDTIRVGTPLGLGGRTGRATTEHLHFEIRKRGKTLNSEHFFNFDDCIVKTFVLLKDPESFKENEPEKASEVIAERGVYASNNKDLSSLNASEKKFHTIRKGDTLFSLSRRYGTTVKEICKLNNIRSSTTLKIGKKLRVI